ncbi:putative acyl-CoA dehydrogenase [Thermoplasmatales archaeon]|nr:putative acyl-CoA dehydrogenase [Thermoplasmatales archaeon]
MISEEYKILADTVREFSGKNLEGSSLKIERGGLGEDIILKMAGQGFLGAKIPVELGGSGIDEKGYLIILENLARVSPSAALKVLINNSLFYPLVAESGDRDTIAGVASGKINATVALEEVQEGFLESGKLSLSGGKLSGTKIGVINSDAGVVVALGGESGKELFLIRNGVSRGKDNPSLGFRGLALSQIVVDSDNYANIGSEGLEQMTKVMDALDLETSAIALGISEGALNKAIEYTKVRSTFEHLLKDYEPVAFSLSHLSAEIDTLKSFLFDRDELDAKEKLELKFLSVDLAKRCTKQALQSHGGYGYLQDFGVEKFYRDAMALSSMFFRRERDNRRLSEEVFQGKAGFI